MKTINDDGGPAFPSSVMDFQPETGSQIIRCQYYGLTVRDWFAGMALQGMMANQGMIDVLPAAHSPRFSKEAYALADAMLEARKP